MKTRMTLQEAGMILARYWHLKLPRHIPVNTSMEVDWRTSPDEHANACVHNYNGGPWSLVVSMWPGTPGRRRLELCWSFAVSHRVLVETTEAGEEFEKLGEVEIVCEDRRTHDKRYMMLYMFSEREMSVSAIAKRSNQYVHAYSDEYVLDLLTEMENDATQPRRVQKMEDGRFRRLDK